MSRHAAMGTASDSETPPISLAILIALVTSVQVLTTFTVLALPTLATRAAATFGHGAEAVGFQISVVYLAAAGLSSIAGLIVKRYGAVMASLMALALSGLALLGVAVGRVEVAVLASLLMGCAYGLTNPAASHLLLKYAPRHRQNLIFAVKQTGVPLGAMLAALALPALSERVGWQMALVLGAVPQLLLAVPLLRIRGRIDVDRDPSALAGGGMLKGLGLVIANPMMRSLAIMGWAYASFQLCLLAFIVTMLVQDLGWTLVSAGIMATVMQIGGATGRIAWSLLADRIGRGHLILVGIGIGSAVLAGLVAVATPAWPVALLSLVLFCFGFSLVGWNGLWMAEIARTAGLANVGLATGGVLVFTYVGIVTGPAAFAAAYRVLGSYGATFGVFGLLPAFGALALLIGTWRAGTDARSAAGSRK